MTGAPAIDRDLSGIAPDDVHDEYARRGLDAWPDARLVAAVGEVVSVPKAAPADSFVLHAPLELLARALLLPMVAPSARQDARKRLVWLAATYEAAGDSVDPPARGAAPGDPSDRPDRLVAALAAGDLDDVDGLAVAFAAQATPGEIRRALAAPVVASLGAAAHGAILLNLLERGVKAGATPALVRGPLREIARYPDWRLRWFEHPDLPPAPASLADALLDVPRLGLPGSDFIFPIMSQAEESGVAPRLLSGLVRTPTQPGVAGADLLRIAAWSMAQEAPTFAPYGWTHCLTMPQAVLGLAGDADAAVTLAVAVGPRPQRARFPGVPAPRRASREVHAGVPRRGGDERERRPALPRRRRPPPRMVGRPTRRRLRALTRPRHARRTPRHRGACVSSSICSDDGPTSSALTAPRSPIGRSGPTVVSWRVCASNSAFSSAPPRTA